MQEFLIYEQGTIRCSQYVCCWSIEMLLIFEYLLFLAALLNVFISCDFMVESLKSFVYWTIWSTNKDSLTSFFLLASPLSSSLDLLLKLRLKALYWVGLDQVNILALFLSFYSFNTILAVGLLHIALSVEIGSLCL